MDLVIHHRTSTNAAYAIHLITDDQAKEQRSSVVRCVFASGLVKVLGTVAFAVLVMPYERTHVLQKENRCRLAVIKTGIMHEEISMEECLEYVEHVEVECHWRLGRGLAWRCFVTKSALASLEQKQNISLQAQSSRYMYPRT